MIIEIYFIISLNLELVLFWEASNSHVSEVKLYLNIIYMMITNC